MRKLARQIRALIANSPNKQEFDLSIIDTVVELGMTRNQRADMSAFIDSPRARELGNEKSLVNIMHDINGFMGESKCFVPRTHNCRTSAGGKSSVRLK